MIKVIRFFSVIFLVFSMLISSTGAPALLIPQLKDSKLLPQPKEAKAHYGYLSGSSSVTTGNQLTHHSYTQFSDNNYWRVLSTSSGLDATITIPGVELNSANMLYVNYDGSASSASLTYAIQIRDFTNSVWRTINPHEANLANTTDSGAGLLYQPTAAVFGMGQIPVYDGYFSNGSNTPVSTPLTNFVNGSSEVQIRFLYSGVTANLELRVDYLTVEPAIENAMYASSLTNTAGGTRTNEYNDTTTDDNATNLNIAANGSGVDFYLSFTNLPTAYTGANVILAEVSSFRTTITNYTVSIRDFTNAQWDTLSGTALTHTSDRTDYFATSTAQAVTDYISSGEVRLRFSSASTSGSVTVDFARVTVGSVNTNTGFYLGEISRGTVSSGTVANTTAVDTSAADSNWVIASSTTDNTATTLYPGDCPAPTNNCAAVNIQIPVTVPSNSTVTGVHTMMRWQSSVTTLDFEYGIRNRWKGNVALSLGGDFNAMGAMVRQASYPMAPQVGTLPLATIPIYEPEYYINTVDNAANLYLRTTSTTTSGNLSIDFAFVSIRTIGPERSISNAWNPSNSVLTNGTNNASNFRYANADDGIYYSVTRNGTTGTDYYFSFSNVTIPTGSNKLIINNRMRVSVASVVYSMFIWDFVGSTWREVTPRTGDYTSDATLNTEELVQVEVYNGYFSDTADVPVSTPLSNFVSSSEVRVRLVSTSTTANLEVDWISIEFAEDPVYFAADSTITNGTRTNEYNDTTTDDASGYTITNSGGIDFYFSFTGVITPPTGSNAMYIPISANMAAGATSYTVSVRNFTAGTWEALNATALTNTADANNYFIKSITTWSDYISGGEIRVRFNSAAAGGSVTVDYIKVILGSVNTDAAGNSILFGGIYRNTIANARTLDTSTTYNPVNHAYGIRNYPNSQTNAEILEAPSALDLTIDLPVTLPTNSAPKAVIYMTKGAASAATITPAIGFNNHKIGVRSVVNQQGTTLALNALPNAVNGSTYNTTTETIYEGWGTENVPNLFDTQANDLRLRFRTTASTQFGAHYLNLDAVFIALRYVD